MSNIGIHKKLILDVLYGSSSGRRFTQDTPVLPEVWIELSKNPNLQTSCLIIPRKGNQAHHVADEIHERATSYRKIKSVNNKRQGCGISDMPGLIAAKIYFDETTSPRNSIKKWYIARGLYNSGR